MFFYTSQILECLPRISSNCEDLIGISDVFISQKSIKSCLKKEIQKFLEVKLHYVFFAVSSSLIKKWYYSQYP